MRGGGASLRPLLSGPASRRPLGGAGLAAVPDPSSAWGCPGSYPESTGSAEPVSGRDWRGSLREREKGGFLPAVSLVLRVVRPLAAFLNLCGGAPGKLGSGWSQGERYGDRGIQRRAEARRQGHRSPVGHLSPTPSPRSCARVSNRSGWTTQ